MIPNWAKVGAKVVCVDVEPMKGFNPNMDGLSVECVYTIREVVKGTWGGWGVRLREIKRSHRWFEQPFAVYRFRPLITQQDDISLFTHLLNTTSEDQLIKEEA